jgi:hypothetical protein
MGAIDELFTSEAGGREPSRRSDLEWSAVNSIDLIVGKSYAAAAAVPYKVSE